jgi:hypothetical protein
MAETGDLLGLLRQRGYMARSMSVSHLDQVQEDVERWQREGVLDRELYATYLARFK